MPTAAPLPFLILTACLGVVGCSPTDKPGAKAVGRASSSEPSGVAPEGGFHLAKAERRLVERAVVATGSLVAQDETPVAVRVAGRLESIEVDLGSVVKAGQVIARVEAEDFALRLRQAEAALGQARARVGLPLEGEDDQVVVDESPAVKQARAVLEEAKANRTRIEELSRMGILSASELETATASFKVSSSRYDEALEEARIRVALLRQRRAEVDIARKQLADTRIQAPFDGAVQERRANVGEYLALGAPVVVLVRTDPLRLRVAIPEREAARIRLGQEVRVRVEGEDRVYKGKVSRLSPAILPGSRTLVVEADVGSEGRLRPGSFARAEIVTLADLPVVTVPPEAIVAFAGVEKVFVVTEGRAAETRVTTGARGAGWVEIVEGLTGEEDIVLSPGGLQTGHPVRVAAVAAAPGS